jgi:hypothetical protein
MQSTLRGVPTPLRTVGAHPPSMGPNFLRDCWIALLRKLSGAIGLVLKVFKVLQLIIQLYRL